MIELFQNLKCVKHLSSGVKGFNIYFSVDIGLTLYTLNISSRIRYTNLINIRVHHMLLDILGLHLLPSRTQLVYLYMIWHEVLCQALPKRVARRDKFKAYFWVRQEPRSTKTGCSTVETSEGNN